MPVIPAHLKPAILACLSFVGFSLTDTIIKFQVQTYDLFTVVFYIHLSAFIVSSLYILQDKGLPGFMPRRPVKYHVARVITLIINSIALAAALKHIPLADYYGFIFLTPLVTALLAYVMLKESIYLYHWISIGTGFTGVLLIASPTFQDFNIGYVYAAAVPVCLAFNAVILRLIGPDEYPAVFPLLTSGGIALATSISFAFGHSLPDVGDMLMIFGGGIVLALSILAITQAFVLATSAVNIAPLQYTSIIWATLFGYFVFGTIPSLLSTAGIAIIILSGLYLILRKHKART